MATTNSFKLTNITMPSLSPNRRGRSRPPVVVRARMGRSGAPGDNGGFDYDGKLVDDNLVVLRKRIHEAEMAEKGRSGLDAAPSGWMEWENRYYNSTHYCADVCEAVGLLQSLLMNTRPSAALGALVLVVLSVPTLTAVVLGHLVWCVVEIGKCAFGGNFS